MRLLAAMISVLSTRSMHFCLLLACLILPACGLLPPVPQPLQQATVSDAVSADCLALYSRLEQRLQKLQLTDTQAARVPGFPYLRVNRFLASYRGDDLTTEQTYYWLQQLAQLDNEARIHEISALAETDLALIEPGMTTRQALIDRLADCSDHLLAVTSRDGKTVALIKDRAKVPDDYSEVKRVIGLYPLTALFVYAGVQRLHDKVQTTFSTPQSELPVRGMLVRYVPSVQTMDDSGNPWSDVLHASVDSPLGIPVLNADQKQRLLEHFAPIWEIDTLDRNDRVGSPVWQQNDEIAIDTDQPVVFQYLSYTRFKEEALLQLNYVLWFPSRPATGPFDILSGRLDGLTWRVTLDLDGKPLIYDVMHNCGCYHMFFPSTRLKQLPPSGRFEEPLLVPENAPGLTSNERIVVRMSAVSHYVEALRVAKREMPSRQYVLKDYQELRSLPLTATRTKSLFRPDSIVEGTERKEKYLLWPMGILQPGAMRQRGHHATAFVGRRHFDDPYLVDNYFSRK